MDLPPLPLDRDDERPLAVQLAAALRAAAVDGTLRAGDRLPSTRLLAGTLGVSRTVTSAAYDQLLAEGWVAARHGSGTFVVGMPARSPAPPAPSTRRPPSEPAPVRVNLRSGVPCVEVLDRAAWRRAWRVASDAPPDAEPDSAGLPEVRSGVVDHLMRHRGLPADPADVLVTAGSTAAVGEVAHILPTGATVAVEEPGYQRALGGFRAAGLVVVPVPVDDAGLVVAAIPPGVAAVYCTPAHQFPLGPRLSAARRVALVGRARAEGFLVIEDDYDGELRYDVAPLPLLAALGPDVVVHLGTASKILTPTLGVGWLVAPPAVRAALLDARERTGTRPARAGQRVFAALAANGDLARHLRRLRRELADRRAASVAAVVAAGHAVLGDAAGTHIAVPLRDPATERSVLAMAAGRGVELEGFATHHAAAPHVAGIVLGYSGPQRRDLDQALIVVREVLVEHPV